jgi:hypothetical protein
MAVSSALRITQRWSVDLYGVAVMANTAQQRIDHGRISQEVTPCLISKIRGYNRAVAVIALPSQQIPFFSKTY